MGISYLWKLAVYLSWLYISDYIYAWVLSVDAGYLCMYPGWLSISDGCLLMLAIYAWVLDGYLSVNFARKVSQAFHIIVICRESHRDSP
jgi:hypothetical protein